eukprot:4223152-Pleurochrysis_carterae.AAC.1
MKISRERLRRLTLRRGLRACASTVTAWVPSAASSDYVTMARRGDERLFLSRTAALMGEGSVNRM